MTLIEQIQQNVTQLPSDKQMEVLDFITFLRQRVAGFNLVRPHSLKSHGVFGSWQARKIDAIFYQQALRAEWDNS